MKYKNSVRSILLRDYKKKLLEEGCYSSLYIEFIKEQIKLLEEKEEIKWKPKKGESYCFSDLSYGEIVQHEFWENDIYDKFRLKHNLVFKTKKEAEKRLKEILEKL